MPDTTQMEAILKGFPNVMDFYQFKVNSKNLDMSKVNFKSHLKILHQLTTPNFQFMIKSSQIDKNVCDWCQLLHFFQLFDSSWKKVFYASHCIQYIMITKQFSFL